MKPDHDTFDLTAMSSIGNGEQEWSCERLVHTNPALLMPPILPEPRLECDQVTITQAGHMSSVSSVTPTVSPSDTHPMHVSMCDCPPTVLAPATCVRRGFCPISRQQSHARKIYYELHGVEDAAHKMVFIMGLNNTCFSWCRQVEHFSTKPDHSVLVFDNRGVGYSDTGPIEPYKTSEMAKDVADLLDHLGWFQDRSIHLVGVSMGGMITQELCFLIPNRIISVLFTSTKARTLHLPSFNVIYQSSLLNLTLANQAQRVATLVNIIFPSHYLDAPAPPFIHEKVTNRAWQEAIMGFHHTVMRPQSIWGELGQTWAALFHSCSSQALARLGSMLAPAKVMILTGDMDEVMSAEKSVELHRDLPGSELEIWSGGGHALCAQMDKEFNMLIERVMSDGIQAMRDAGQNLGM